MDFETVIPGNMEEYTAMFLKNFYPERFQEYCALAGGSLTQAKVEEAEALVAWMDRRVKGLLRKRARLEQELFLMEYVVPAATALGREDLAHALREAWNRAHPDLQFKPATYEELNSSFRDTVLGFRI